MKRFSAALCTVLLTLACFLFVGCNGSDSDLLKRIEALERQNAAMSSQISALDSAVEALKAAGVTQGDAIAAIEAELKKLKDTTLANLSVQVETLVGKDALKDILLGEMAARLTALEEGSVTSAEFNESIKTLQDGLTAVSSAKSITRHVYQEGEYRINPVDTGRQIIPTIEFRAAYFYAEVEKILFDGKIEDIIVHRFVDNLNTASGIGFECGTQLVANVRLFVGYAFN